MKTILITGASSGIGLALAKLHIDQGDQVILMARRRERLPQGERIHSVIGDVNDEATWDALNKHLMITDHLDWIYANAGFGVAGAVEKLKLEDYRRQFETNVFSVIRTIQAALPWLKRSRGSIGIVGSVNSYLPLPKKSPYCMSKYAVRALSECLSEELKSQGVSVTLFCPGLIESEIRKIDNRGVFRPEFQDPAPSWLVMDAETCARKMIHAMRARKKEVVITAHGKILVWMSRFIPWILPVFSDRTPLKPDELQSPSQEKQDHGV